MKIAQLLKRFDLDAIVGVDWESYYDDKYSLRHMDTTDYIVDPRFKAHCVSVQTHDMKCAIVLTPKELKSRIAVKWNRVGVLCHHAHFDGLILSHHFGIRPKMFFCTMSMGAPLLPIHVSRGLDGMCKAMGLKGKVGADSLEAVKGVRDMTPAQYKKLAKYAGNDIQQTWLLFKKLLPYFPVDELPIVDMTVQMYTNPLIVINRRKMLAVVKFEQERKQALLDVLKLSKDDLSKNARFIGHLRAAGVEPPMKISPTKFKDMEEGDEITDEDFVPALAASDLAFKQLLAHPRKRIRQLVEARFAIKSALLESKATRLAERAKIGPASVYLNYAKAKTWRWTGSDGMNWQNLTSKRKPGGQELRAALEAPKGCVFIIADQAQIEARGVAWFCRQENIVDAFRNKRDVYKEAAADVYRKDISDITPAERFLGKTGVLGCGFQAGPKRFAGMVRIGQFGPPMDITDEDAAEFVASYRATNWLIARGWRNTQDMVRQAFVSKIRLEHDFGIVYEGQGKNGFMHHTPTGVSMRYDHVELTDRGELTYVDEYRRRQRDEPFVHRTKLYGGILVENRTQFMARLMVAHAMRDIVKLKHTRIVMTTHDEVVCVVPKALAKIRLKEVVEIMTTPPPWAPDIPLAVDAHISTRYDK